MPSTRNRSDNGRRKAVPTFGSLTMRIIRSLMAVNSTGMRMRRVNSAVRMMEVEWPDPPKSSCERRV